jgi:hypothetical protein
MGLQTANGHAILKGTLALPLVGAWQAELAIDAEDGLDGATTIELADGALNLVGTTRGGVFVDGTYVRIFAGKDGLGRDVRPRHYNSVSVNVVLNDILRVTGDSLSPTADRALLSRTLPAWTLTKGRAGRAIDALVKAAGAGASSWRFLPDGSLWVGAETWPASGLDRDVDVLDEQPQQRRMLLGVEAPTLLPGTTLFGRRVTRVEYQFKDAGARMLAWFET